MCSNFQQLVHYLAARHVLQCVEGDVAELVMAPPCVVIMSSGKADGARDIEVQHVQMIRWVKQSLDRHSDLRVLLRDNAQNLLNDSLLIDSVAIDAQRTHQAGEAKHKVVHMLAVVEGEQFPVAAEALQGHLPCTVRANMD